MKKKRPYHRRSRSKLQDDVADFTLNLPNKYTRREIDIQQMKDHLLQ